MFTIKGILFLLPLTLFLSCSNLNLPSKPVWNSWDFDLKSSHTLPVPKEMVLASVRQIAGDDKGWVFVVDGKQTRIMVFSSDGSHFSMHWGKRVKDQVKSAILPLNSTLLVPMRSSRKSTQVCFTIFQKSVLKKPSSQLIRNMPGD